MIASSRSRNVSGKAMSAELKNCSQWSSLKDSRSRCAIVTLSRVILLLAAIGCLGCSDMVRVTVGSRDYNLTVEDTHGFAGSSDGKNLTFTSEDAVRMIAPAFELLAVRQDQSLRLFFQPRHGLRMDPFMIEERGKDYQSASLPPIADHDTIERVDISAFLVFHLNDILKDADAQMKSTNGRGPCVLVEWIIKNRTFPFRFENLKNGQRWTGSATATDKGLKLLKKICDSSADTRPDHDQQQDTQIGTGR